MLFVATTCPWCERSLPSYRTLAEALEQSGMSMLVVLTDKTGKVTGEQYVRDRKLTNAVAVKASRLPQFNLKGTPTLVAYNADGIVTGSWAGMLNGDGQQQVRRHLNLSDIRGNLPSSLSLGEAPVPH